MDKNTILPSKAFRNSYNLAMMGKEDYLVFTAQIRKGLKRSI